MQPSLLLRQLFDRASSTYTYLIADRASGEAALIDPVLGNIDRDLALLRELQLTLRWVLDTHVHADHITAAGLLRERTRCGTAASVHGAPCLDRALQGGAVVLVGTLQLEVLATPGHTDDSLSFVLPGHVFTGDALLVRGCGRTDFQNGSATQLFHSITEVLLRLPPETIVWPGHDYRGMSHSTVEEERMHNPRIAGHTQASFVALMDGLNLPPPPANIQSAVPANLGCGTAPTAVGESELALPEIAQIAPVAIASLSANVRMIDVREHAEWISDLGHIGGANLVPLGELAGVAGNWNRAQTLVLICRSGKRSTEAARVLTTLGFKSLFNMRGGMLAYAAAGLPVER